MNIVDAFLKLDKLTEASENDKLRSSKLRWPQYTLCFPRVELEFPTGSSLRDVEFSVNGWDVVCYLTNNNIIKEEDFPEYFKLAAADKDKWLLDNFKDLTNTYEDSIYNYYETSEEYDTALSDAQADAYADAIDYSEYMYEPDPFN